MKGVHNVFSNTNIDDYWKIKKKFLQKLFFLFFYFHQKKLIKLAESLPM